nr:hypothetical protein [Azospirillum argentinense]
MSAMRSLCLRVVSFTAALALAVPIIIAGIGIGIVVTLPFIASALPLELTRVTLTDGSRQVEMQGMIHIASPDFYRDVADLVAKRRTDGWLVFYEGVRDDLGRGNTEIHPYEMMAPALGEGLMLQDNAKILGLPGVELRNVDVTLSELLAGLPPPPSPDHDDPPEVSFTLAEAREMFDALPGWAQRRVRAAYQILLATTTSGRFAHQVLSPAITTLREQRVARAIEDAQGVNVLVIYGQLHINAICAHLSAADPAWHPLSTISVRPF